MTLDEARLELATALQPLTAEITDLQVYDYWNDTPSPPAVDMYPATPFMETAGMGVQSVRVYFTVRARVAMHDIEAGQQLLYRMLDVGDPASVEAALADSDWTVAPDGVNGFTQYADDAPTNERLLGCEWRVTKFL